MADWRRRSIAAGPSPATPDEDIAGALHFDFFYRPIAFPCDGAGGTRELDAAIMPTPLLTKATIDEAFLLPAADGDTRMAVTPPANVVPPLRPRQYQPIGTTATGGGGSRRQRSCRPHGSGGRVSCPSSSQLPPLPEHIAVSFVNNEAGEDEGAAMSPGRSDDDEEEAMLYAHNDHDEEEAMSSGRSDEDDEAMSSGSVEEDDEATSSDRGEEDDEATSSGRDEEDYEDEAMSSERGEDEDEEQDEEEMLTVTESEEEEEEEPKVPDKCKGCGSMVALVMLLPCRHSCYCALCFRNSRWRSGPARLHCPVCGRKYERGHPQSGRLGPTKFR